MCATRRSRREHCPPEPEFLAVYQPPFVLTNLPDSHSLAGRQRVSSGQAPAPLSLNSRDDEPNERAACHADGPRVRGHAEQIERRERSAVDSQIIDYEI